MTLSSARGNTGKITSIGGDDETHRRLVDMGLVGLDYAVSARRGKAVLVDFGDFSAVVRDDVAKLIGVSEK